jgi:hypothetical protein
MSLDYTEYHESGLTGIMVDIKNEESLAQILSMTGITAYSHELDREKRNTLMYLLKYNTEQLNSEDLSSLINFLVLTKGENVNHEDCYHCTPVWYALNYNHPLAVLDTLVKLGGKVNANHIMDALGNRNTSLLTTLVKLGGQVDATHIQFVLQWKRVDESILTTLVKLGGKVDESHIKYALAYCLPSLLTTLVELGGKVDDSIIDYAVKYRCTDLVLDTLTKLYKRGRFRN